MKHQGDLVLSVLLWFFGGTVYFLLEVAYKYATGNPQRISWVMLVLAIVLTIPVERCGAQLPWSVPLWLQAAACALLVTGAELVVGCVANLLFGMDIWDYSHLWGNLWGQVCPQFALLWFVLCFLFIPLFDWLRFAVEGGVRPCYGANAKDVNVWNI